MEEFYLMTKERENVLWDSALIVFDTNAICSLYSMTKDTQKTMLSIIEYLKEKFWIPSHVLYEYHKNRISVIDQSMNNRFVNPSFFNDQYLHHLKGFLEKITKEPYYQPGFDELELEEFKKNADEVEASMDKIKKAVLSQFSKRREEISSLKKSDDILKVIHKLPSGKGFSYKEKIEIMKEGEWRYKQELPPGYMDFSGKHGIQKYGDLIIWKEILQKSKDAQRSIIFVTRDTKEDWYEEHDKKNGPESPRHELLLEFSEETGNDIWLYTLDQFVAKLETRYKDDTSVPFKGGLESVKNVLQSQMKRNEEIEKNTIIKMGIVCDNCGHTSHILHSGLNSDWALTNINDRNMGPEREYECTEVFKCSNCGKKFMVRIRVWEYPLGLFNYAEIESDGCEITDKEIHLSELIPFLPEIFN